MSDRFAPVVALLEAKHRAGELPGWAFAVRVDDRTVHLVGGHLDDAPGRPVTAATPWRLASVSKLFGAALAVVCLDDGVVALEDPVERWLPAFEQGAVLRDPAGPLADTVPLDRPVTVLDLLRSTAGFGAVWDESPLALALADAGLAVGPFPPLLDPDEHVRRLAALPLAEQPGTRFRYHTSADLLGTVLARAAGMPLEQLLAERLLGPLGLTGVRWHADAAVSGTAWRPTATLGRALLDPPDGRWARPPVFPSLGTGLLAPAGDVLGLLDALAGRRPDVLPVGDLAAVRTDHLDRTVRGDEVLDDTLGWGWQCAVAIGEGPPGRAPGAFGWDGGTGTSAWVDPSRGAAAVTLTAVGARRWLVDELWSTIAACIDGVTTPAATSVGAQAAPRPPGVSP